MHPLSSDLQAAPPLERKIVDLASRFTPPSFWKSAGFLERTSLFFFFSRKAPLAALFVASAAPVSKAPTVGAHSGPIEAAVERLPDRWAAVNRAGSRSSALPGNARSRRSRCGRGPW
jgi:hypothetical protein